jgi:aminopeptidase N
VAERRFKYTREDFGELPVKLVHLTIYLNFLGDTVEAKNCLEMVSVKPLDSIELDARDLEIISVEWCAGPTDSKGAPLSYEYSSEKNKLHIKLLRPVKEGERFFVRTLTRCAPSERVLEGIYKDTTPPGAPQQYISQCQQWGFQRIMPIFDDCRAKCTMTTTIEADSRYTHLISNGNISLAANPDGTPVSKPGDARRRVITYENPVPTPPYLFLVCVGTWDTLVDEVTYPTGRTVRLEYLVPPGSKEYVRIPMAILKESVLWVEKTQGYEYGFDTYRTICMTRSNFGGMENLGNTTIVTDAALVTEHTLDSMLIYAHAVIVHEFEHNQCGSETTMETPFDVWLNEAYTVDVERQFMADIFDPGFVRLYQVEAMRAPLAGPLTVEDAGHFGRIVRDGFNDPEELIDGVTYVKAAEVIRMLRLLVGPEAFKAGKTLYFSRYRYANANTDQFFECFEEASKISLDQFKRGWLFRIGYPKVSAKTEYDRKTGRFRILFRQESGGAPFSLPITVALVNNEGQDIAGTEKVFILKDDEAELSFDNLSDDVAFASINRDCSFYGTLRIDADARTLAAQVRLDPNAFNRVEAMRKLTDIVRIGLVTDPDTKVSEEWLTLYGEILSDQELPASLKAYMLRIDEQPLDRAYATWFQELVIARERIMREVNARYRTDLVREFEGLRASAPKGGPPRKGLEERMLRNVLLELIAIDDSAGSRRLLVDHFRSAATATDRVAALTLLNRSGEPSRRNILEEVYTDWHAHLSGYANYLRIVSSGTRDDVFEMIEAESSQPTFDITQPTWCRALFLTMASNNKMVWTDKGIEWVADKVIYLAPINGTIASRLLNTFQHVRSLKPGLRDKVIKALERIVREVANETSATIHGQASTYLGK